MRSIPLADTRGERVLAPAGQHFQPEIQGMRALSVLAVVWAHARLPGLPGGFTGVDVFFVISGFLITRLLLAEMARTGRIDLLAFWARRARRLLPNAFAALIGTVLLALFLFPGYSPGQLAREVMFAALEFANFHFADEAVDYFQSENAASPVLHFWSLSVEEQFYMVWPPVLLGIGLYFRRSFLRSAVIFLALIWCASFAACLYITYHDQPLAYFGTGTRCWQLATGGLIAAGWSSIERLPPVLRNALAWLGLAAILTGMAVLRDNGFYPGAWALLPTFGAAGLIAGFGAASPTGLLRRGLSAPVMQWIGERSYSWYLWHWPLLALPRVTFPDSAYIEAIALPALLLVACAAYRWIEAPIRKGRILRAGPLPTLAGGAAALAAVIAVGYLHMPVLLLTDKSFAARIAWVETASKDISRAILDGCHLEKEPIQQPDCLYGDITASRRAVLFGDSHAMHWFEGFHSAAQTTGWQLPSWTKNRCPSVDMTQFLDNSPYLACLKWRADRIVKMIGADRPDLVIMSNRTDYYKMLDNPEISPLINYIQKEYIWKAGFRSIIQKFLSANIQILIIRDIPRARSAYRKCLGMGETCESPRTKAFANNPPLDQEVASEFGDRVIFADFSDEFCSKESCAVTKNGIIIYRDSHHLTPSIAATFAPQMAKLLQTFADRRSLAHIGGSEQLDARLPPISVLHGSGAAGAINSVPAK
jgi:peptidoglycan/LPS O-acetylase OafA/YrhL